MFFFKNTIRYLHKITLTLTNDHTQFQNFGPKIVKMMSAKAQKKRSMQIKQKYKSSLSKEVQYVIVWGKHENEVF